MWRKTCLAVAVCAALTLFTNSSAKALLVPGSYTISLTGALIDPSTGTFDVVGTAIQNFTMDLLQNGLPASSDSTYSTAPALLTNVFPGTMFSGTVNNDFFTGDQLLFINDGTWVCNSALCVTSFDNLVSGAGGEYSISQTSVSEIPLPAALWMFLSGLGGLGLFGWRRRRIAA